IFANWRLIFKSFYYNKATIGYTIMMSSWAIVCRLTDYRVTKLIKKSQGIKHIQAIYMSIAFTIGLIGGGSILLPAWGINLYPAGNLGTALYALIGTYAILRYRLMDINVAITRVGVFIAVYTIVLGLPFALANWLKLWLIDTYGSGWWMAPLILMAVLATAGPFIYIYLQHRAEDKLLREQRRYQDTLKQASVGMTRIRNLRKLLDLIAHIVTKTVRISFAAIYLYNEQTDEYVLQVSRDKGRAPLAKIRPDNPLLAWIMVRREPLIYEEIKRISEDTGDETFKLLEENMRLLYASVIIPSFLEDKFIGFFVLGDKISGQIYTPDDLSVFQVLASQAALAIENAQFYEEAKEMQDQIAQAEKMATIGTMADGLSHQINNRFYALSLIAGDTIDTIKMTDTTKCTPEVKEMIDSINHALQRIQNNVIQGGEVVRGLLKYSRKGDASFDAVELNTIISNTLEMVQFKVKLSEIDIVRNFPEGLPKIKGNLVQLEEAFFNFIDNAYDAIVERRETLKESGYRGKITISAKPKENNLEILVEDNGMGVKDSNTNKVFTPFFTTKTSSRKGTGLGLYVIRRIITDAHKGKISFESAYKVGTRFILELPIAR
ncbi:MAG: ATP-binding protein, partial [Candidatus Omnitrophica bacterium]|nr:ATP-binding protein [Candidatus Omnitrophota bacterium]